MLTHLLEKHFHAARARTLVAGLHLYSTFEFLRIKQYTYEAFHAHKRLTYLLRVCFSERVPKDTIALTYLA